MESRPHSYALVSSPVLTSYIPEAFVVHNRRLFYHILKLVVYEEFFIRISTSIAISLRLRSVG